jgi:hypothetical protein
VWIWNKSNYFCNSLYFLLKFVKFSGGISQVLFQILSRCVTVVIVIGYCTVLGENDTMFHQSWVFLMQGRSHVIMQKCHVICIINGDMRWHSMVRHKSLTGDEHHDMYHFHIIQTVLCYLLPWWDGEMLLSTSWLQFRLNKCIHASHWMSKCTSLHFLML